MNQPALIIRPGDWYLCFWWATVPARDIHGCEHEGHVLGWVKRGGPGMPPGWFCGDSSRAGTFGPWVGREMNIPGPAAALIALAGESRERVREACPHAVTGGLDLRGDGAELLSRLAQGAQLPPWLRVIVIEEKPGASLA